MVDRFNSNPDYTECKRHPEHYSDSFSECALCENELTEEEHADGEKK